jgi:ATP-dependent RNA helicase HelY
MRAHPCHGCDAREDHARWAERFHRLQRETDDLRRRVGERTHTIARTFDRICDLLGELGYLDGDQVTDAGRSLAALYTELDLLTADCLRAGVWSGLEPAELAGVVSALVYESRRDDDTSTPALPPGRSREVLAEMEARWRTLEDRERSHRLTPAKEPDARFALAAWSWCRGRSLDAVLREADLAPGDFVRWTKQVVDLLGQVADAARADPSTAPVGVAARTAADQLRRGVVAYSSVA